MGPVAGFVDDNLLPGGDFISGNALNGGGAGGGNAQIPFNDLFSTIFDDKTAKKTRGKFDFFPGIFGGKPGFDQSRNLANLVQANLAQQLPISQTSGSKGGAQPDSSNRFTSQPFGRPSQPAFRQQVPTRQGQPSGVPALNRPSRATSAFQDPLKQALLNPQFGATSASEKALLKSISDQTQGASALRGLGPSTQGALAQNLAPALIGLRQKNINNLRGALGQDINSQISQRGQDIGFGLSQRGQDITQQRQRQAQQQAAIAQLLQLAQLATPNLVATGQDVSSVSRPGLFSRGTDVLGAL